MTSGLIVSDVQHDQEEQEDIRFVRILRTRILETCNNFKKRILRDIRVHLPPYFWYDDETDDSSSYSFRILNICGIEICISHCPPLTSHATYSEMMLRNTSKDTFGGIFSPDFFPGNHSNLFIKPQKNETELINDILLVFSKLHHCKHQFLLLFRQWKRHKARRRILAFIMQYKDHFVTRPGSQLYRNALTRFYKLSLI